MTTHRGYRVTTPSHFDGGFVWRKANTPLVRRGCTLTINNVAETFFERLKVGGYSVECG